MHSQEGNLNVQQDSGLSVLETPEKLRIRTLIVDSDPDAVMRLQEIIRQDPDIDILGFCGNGNEALSVIRASKPDLIFLDVNIPGIDGFSLLEKLRPGPMPVVIFVTAYDRYALQAFEVSALDYVLKPFGADRVRRALQKVKALVRHEDKPANGASLQKLAIRSGKKVFFLRPEEVDWIEAEGNSVRLHSGSQSHTLKMSISSLEIELDPSRFVRIHRSTIVNLDKVRWLEPSVHGTYRVILEDGTQLVLSRKDKLHVLTGKTIRSRE
jgi:two-component system LytT family response regulator